MPKGQHFKKQNPKIYQLSVKINKRMMDSLSDIDNKGKYVRDLIIKDLKSKTNEIK